MPQQQPSAESRIEDPATGEPLGTTTRQRVGLGQLAPRAIFAALPRLAGRSGDHPLRPAQAGPAQAGYGPNRRRGLRL